MLSVVDRLEIVEVQQFGQLSCINLVAVVPIFQQCILPRVVVPFAVGAYITAACWFTASTSFANPAVTIARSLSDAFAGIRPIDAPLFILAQLLRALAATFLFR